MGACRRDFSLRPKEKKNKKKQTNKQKQGRFPAILWSDWLLWNKTLDPGISDLFGSDHP